MTCKFPGKKDTGIHDKVSPETHILISRHPGRLARKVILGQGSAKKRGKDFQDPTSPILKVEHAAPPGPARVPAAMGSPHLVCFPAGCYHLQEKKKRRRVNLGAFRHYYCLRLFIHSFLPPVLSKRFFNWHKRFFLKMYTIIF